MHSTLCRYCWTILAVLCLTLAPTTLRAQNDAGDKDKPKPALDGNTNLKPDAGTVGWLELSGPLADGPQPFSVTGLTGGGPMGLRGVVAKIHHVAEDRHYRGLVLYLDSPALTQAQVFEIDQALRACRVAGKKIVVFAEAYDLGTYQLACSADVILLQRKGMIEMAGLGAEEMYMAGLLEKIGAKADFLQVGKYKGAAEPLTNKGPSPEWSENFDKLLDDMYDQTLVRIARARNLEKAEVEKAMADSWTLSDDDLVKRGLVDHVVDRDLTAITNKLFGEGFEWDLTFGEKENAVDFNNPFALLQMMLQPASQQLKRDTIAIVYANGAITSGKSGGGLFGGETVGSKTFTQALREARDNPKIKGVVIRIDSPGGSALASEVMWQAIMDLRKQKPVYVSLGRLAASGGYYLACAGEQIYAAPTTIVGSIGVVGGKIVLGGTYEKLGIGIHRRSRGPGGDMFNSVEPFTAEQRTKLESAFNRIYEQFTSRVKEGRGGRVHDIDAVAAGRLFTGQQGVANGLVDLLGGVDAAVGDMAARTGLNAGAYDVITLPRPPSFPEMIEQMFGVTAPASVASPAAVATMSPETSAVLRTVRAALGEQKWSAARDSLNGIMLMQREPVLTLMPTAVTVK